MEMAWSILLVIPVMEVSLRGVMIVNCRKEILHLYQQLQKAKCLETKQLIPLLGEKPCHNQRTIKKNRGIQILRRYLTTRLKVDMVYSPTSVFKTENKHYAENDEHPKPAAIYRQNSTNILLQGAELPRLDHQLGISLKGNDQVPSLAPPVADLSYKELALKTTVVEHTAEFVDSQKVINDLEEQNSNLVEEKTKLSVQLGVQTKV